MQTHSLPSSSKHLHVIHMCLEPKCDLILTCLSWCVCFFLFYVISLLLLLHSLKNSASNEHVQVDMPSFPDKNLCRTKLFSPDVDDALLVMTCMHWPKMVFSKKKTYQASQPTPVKGIQICKKRPNGTEKTRCFFHPSRSPDQMC